MAKNRRHDIVKPSKYKTSLCSFFLSESGCPFGDKCAFAHGESDLRPESPKEAKKEATDSSGAASLSSEPGAAAAAQAAGANAATSGGGAEATKRRAVGDARAHAGSSHHNSNSNNNGRGAEASLPSRVRPQRQRGIPGQQQQQQQHRQQQQQGLGGYGGDMAANPFFLFANDAMYNAAYLGSGAFNLPAGVAQHPVYSINNSSSSINAVPEMLTPFLAGGGLPMQQAPVPPGAALPGDGKRIVSRNTRVAAGVTHTPPQPQGSCVLMMPYSPFDPAHPGGGFQAVGMHPFLVGYGPGGQQQQQQPPQPLGFPGTAPGVVHIPASRLHTMAGSSAGNGAAAAAEPSVWSQVFGGAGVSGMDALLGGPATATAAAAGDDDDTASNDWNSLIDRWLATQPRDGESERGREDPELEAEADFGSGAASVSADPSLPVSRALGEPTPVVLHAPPAGSPNPSPSASTPAATAAAAPSPPRAKICAVWKGAPAPAAAASASASGGARRRRLVATNKFIGSCKKGEDGEAFCVYDAEKSTVLVVTDADGGPPPPEAEAEPEAVAEAAALGSVTAAPPERTAASAAAKLSDGGAVQLPLLGVPILFTKGNKKVLVTGGYSDEDDGVDYCI